ncbi:hypothetical protein KBB96_04960 [Luteolibacter ambystomatis]|uniref:Uncharacterized protein n=1 Tax=Luteolibacter ambystomatis TaxID=2824561 RepID=A0A975PGE9_9BACT|nr:hypothetical protein [Luteolibacter ambystomatis]QUE52242.1 hypothetical protein KBB96_04960 [Luteolibacter ambystomatis]
MNDNEELPERKVAPIQETEEDLCRALWLAVAIQALIDASGKGGNSAYQTQAREWLLGKGGITSDFAAVCDLAGIDFAKTRRRFTKVLKGETESIDFRCTKKAHLRNRSQESRKRYFRRAERNARLRHEARSRILFPNAAMGSVASNDNSINQPMENYA